MVCQRPVMGQFYILYIVVFLWCLFLSGTWEINSKSIPVFLCVRVSVLVWFCWFFFVFHLSYLPVNRDVKFPLSSYIMYTYFTPFAA